MTANSPALEPPTAALRLTTVPSLMRSYKPGPIRTWTGLALAFALAVSTLAACAGEGESDDSRRFANQPVTELPEPTSGFTEPTASFAQPTDPGTALGRNPLDVRGAPSIVYALVDESILAVDTSKPNAFWSIPTVDGFEVIDLVSSPNGDRVAVLARSADTSATRVEVHAWDGQELETWDLEWPVDQSATPIGSGGPDRSGTGTISWTAGGDTLLVSMAGTDLVSIALDGEVRSIAVPGNVGTIVDAAVSPAGSDIAVLSLDEAGNGRIMLIDPNADTPHARQIVPPTDDTAGQGSVSRFTWLPNGSGFAYVLADDVTAGALYTQPVRGGQKTLVASPGRGGPAAQIVDFSLSPQGDVVAYVIGTPDGEAIAFNSLWVRNNGFGEPVRIDTPSYLPVAGMWWTDVGLAWMQDPTLVSVANPDGTLDAISLVPVPSAATPGATPLATPSAGPSAAPDAIFATPHASPEAMPLTATPVASPVD
ncbi:MAG TPA: hypothetical protein VD767_05205 [Thermomicrobiales bacterium]|nr:hypothetical protein [Thermomicrobiales bacterium]